MTTQPPVPPDPAQNPSPEPKKVLVRDKMSRKQVVLITLIGMMLIAMVVGGTVISYSKQEAESGQEAIIAEVKKTEVPSEEAEKPRSEEESKSTASAEPFSFSFCAAIPACPEAPDCNCGQSEPLENQVVITIPEGNNDVGIRFSGNNGTWLPAGFKLTSVKDSNGNSIALVASTAIQGPSVLQLAVPSNIDLLTVQVGRQTFTVPPSQ